MKFIYAVLAVLPAVMAAPPSIAGRDVPNGPGTSYETWACQCRNDSTGAVYVPGSCLYYAGGSTLNGEPFCWPGAYWSIDTPKWTNDDCAKQGTGYNTAVCKTTKVCWYLGDYYKTC